MPNFTISEVSPRIRDWEAHGKKNRSYYVKVAEQTGVYELAQNLDRDPPKAGDRLEATVESREHEGVTYHKLKRVYSNNGRGGGGARGDLSPEAQARIDAVGRIKGRCHAQAVSAQMLAASGDLASVNWNDGNQANAFLTGVFKPLTDWLVKDAETARNQPEGN